MNEKPIDMTLDEACKFTPEAWAAVPGAQVPEPSFRATVSPGGDAIRLEATVGPQDRAVLRQVARDSAENYAAAIGNPAGLRGLFPTNMSRLVHPSQKRKQGA